MVEQHYNLSLMLSFFKPTTNRSGAILRTNDEMKMRKSGEKETKDKGTEGCYSFKRK